MPGKTFLLAIVCLLCTARLLKGQQPGTASDASQPGTLTVTVKVVNVPATVRDKHGAIIRTLTKDDFLLEEDGRPQTVRYFAHDTDLPLTLGLLVDTSMSQRRVLEQERHASYSFIDQMLRQSKDVAFVIHFDHEVELLQDLTSSREKLQSALQSLQVGQYESGNGNGGGQGGTGGGPNGADYPGRGRGGHHQHGFGGGGTLLYDASYLASDELMKKQQGRKALIILSDGVDRGSKFGLQTAIEAAQRADTVEGSDEEAMAAVWDGTGVVPDFRKNHVPTERRFSSRFQNRPAASSLWFPKKSRSKKFTSPSRRTCAINTTWDTPRTLQTPKGATTRSP
jgi:hypothetical protein